MALIPVMPTTKLKNGLEICKIVNGMWQVSGAHGNIDPRKAVTAMKKYAEIGFGTFDMADIYGPAEDIFGTFVNTRDKSSNEIQGLTKLVPRVEDMTKEKVKSHIVKSMQRMNVTCLDCIQLHWWNYSNMQYLKALEHLSGFQSEGLIVELSVTNFDTEHLEIIVSKGIQISTNQIQYSIIDQRPAKFMKPLCEKYAIKLLSYGTLCGGLISEKYLGKPEPAPSELNTASLGKYKNIIDVWGGWSLFQELLQVLRGIADEHSVSIANVAIRYVLNDPVVAAVIIGCRFGVDGCDHTKDNFRSVSASWKLTDQNLAAIKAVQDKSNDLFQVLGDCGGEYR